MARSKKSEACSFDSEACADGLYCDGTSCVAVRDAVLKLTCVQ
ncbi:MAG TPA: hypothetical protein VHU80_21130 [Polyangiaceae bacterium]|nr:hypothetical protein [Polyangiaceae bacterium]